MKRKESEVPSCYHHLTPSQVDDPKVAENIEIPRVYKPQRLEAGEYLPGAGREGMRATAYRY